MAGPFQHIIFAALISCKNRNLIIWDTLIYYNPLYDPASFFTGDNIFHYEVFQQITDTNQIHRLELLTLIFCHITHLLAVL